jgi:cytochrome c oxidase subunit II
MKFGESVRAASQVVKALGLSLALMATSQAVAAAPAAAPAPAVSEAAAPAAVAPAAADQAAAPEQAAAAAGAAYVPMAPTAGKGMPVDKGLDLQQQFSPVGEYAFGLHTALIYLCVIIAAFVLLLLVWVIVRYNKRANPVPSRTSHNTLIEVVWTLIPVLILVGIAVPSMNLLAKQFEPAPEDALTVKVTGYQWYWTYTYPDNGEFEVISNMLPDDKAIANGEPVKLAADYRMVVPAGEPIRLQITAADVIHAFAVPSLWFKLDAVPGRINEKVLFIKEPGVYYGQCSELCGARHAYMPIAVEALPRDKFNAWVLTQSGGKIDGQPEAAPAAAPEAAPAAPAAPAPAV